MRVCAVCRHFRSFIPKHLFILNLKQKQLIKYDVSLLEPRALCYLQQFEMKWFSKDHIFPKVHALF